MTFEIFVYRSQMFAVKLQNQMTGKPAFWKPLAAGLGALIQQFLMGLVFARCLAEGERQCSTQKKKEENITKTGEKKTQKNTKHTQKNGEEKIQQDKEK